MQGEVKRLNGIVEEFLSLARPLAVKPEPLKVGDLIGEVVALVGPDAESRGIGLSAKVPDDLPVMSLDRDQLKQTLLNLVTNAFDAMPGGGTLTIAAAARRDSITLTVEDTGAGIPPDLLPKLFEPWITTKVKGMGLGLPIARRIVEAHGGRIEVKSSPGEGSVFTISLPLSNS
jgi:signal transduction histidine kinase